jgi:hypothetical protein
MLNVEVMGFFACVNTPMATNASPNAPLRCDMIIWECYAPGTHTGETMEKTKPPPAWISGQVRSGQVRSEQILFLLDNITLPGTPGVECNPGKMDRDGA